MLIGWVAKSKNSSIASVRYRCHTPIRALTERGFPVELYDAKRDGRYSLVVFSKMYSPKEQELAIELKRQGVTIALDLCDNHFYNPSNLPSYVEAARNLRTMLELSDCCICSTDALKDEVLRAVPHAPPIFVVGDAAEELPAPRKNWLSIFKKPRTTLLWQGIHGVPNAECGMLDILRISDVLGEVAKEHEFELTVLSNNRAKYKTHIAPLPFPTRYVEWSLPRLRGLLDQAAAVLIPVTSNPFTICKSNNRLTLPLRYGVPVVADSIPSYAEFSQYVFLDRWEEGLRAVLGSLPSVAERTELGRADVRERFSAERLAEQWEKVFREALVRQEVGSKRQINELG